MRGRTFPRLWLTLSGLLLFASAAYAEGGEGGEEHPGTWLNWLYHFRFGGHPVATTPADIAFGFALLLVLALMVVAVIGGRRLSVRPGPLQSLLEMAYGALRGVIEGVMGPKGVDFLPFLGSIFLYVFLMNLMGVLPGFISPTANLSITAAMAVVIFLVVQFYGLKERGLGYLKHFLEGLPPLPAFGSVSAVRYALSALGIGLMGMLIFAIHLIGELVRPVSLALRLFGNISGEETVVLTLVTLVAATKFFWLPVQLPNLLLGLLTAFVQALVMSLLAAVYLSGVVHHEAEAEAVPPSGHASPT